jgi:hypothetical protein
MAKGSRASTNKANNAKLKSRVFGPVETERTARLSAKLLELASQPKPIPRSTKEDAEMEGAEGMYFITFIALHYSLSPTKDQKLTIQGSAETGKAVPDPVIALKEAAG